MKAQADSPASRKPIRAATPAWPAGPAPTVYNPTAARAALTDEIDGVVAPLIGKFPKVKVDVRVEASADVQPGVEFFNRFRDLTATGYFSSRIGVEYLGYIGNAFNPRWTGCGDAAERHLGV